MADEIIKMEISPRQLEQLRIFLASVPRGMKGRALTTFVEYVIGNDNHGLRHYPPYKFVSRAKAYKKVSNDGAPAGYFSWEQFRFVMAGIKNGTIRPGVSNRTGATASGWAYRGDPTTRQTIFNTVPASRYTMGNRTQARQPDRVGWRRAIEVVQSNMKGGMRAAQQAVNRWLKEKR